MKIASLLILFAVGYVLGRKMHNRRRHHNKEIIPCTYHLLTDQCHKHEKGVKLACDQKYLSCRRANGEKCNASGKSVCLSGSECSGTKESNGWGICVNKDSIGDKIEKVAQHMVGVTEKSRRS